MDKNSALSQQQRQAARRAAAVAFAWASRFFPATKAAPARAAGMFASTALDDAHRATDYVAAARTGSIATALGVIAQALAAALVAAQRINLAPLSTDAQAQAAGICDINITARILPAPIARRA